VVLVFLCLYCALCTVCLLSVICCHVLTNKDLYIKHTSKYRRIHRVTFRSREPLRTHECASKLTGDHFTTRSFTGTAREVCSAGSMKRYGARPSGCLSQHGPRQQTLLHGAQQRANASSAMLSASVVAEHRLVLKYFFYFASIIYII